MTSYVCTSTTTTSRASLFLSLFLLFPLVFSQLSSKQTSAMITLFQRLNNSASSLPWNVTGDLKPCLWKGVTCGSNNSSITHLSLSGFDISSSDFLPLVCKIESLQSFDVSNNHLTSIPVKFLSDCGGIDGLKLLNFSKNKLVGPLLSFSNFVGLESLDFSFNSMNGSIGLQLDGLVSLKRLNLSFNSFSGSFPINLGKSMVLEDLKLAVNHFQGPIPPEIANYSNLNLLDLSANNLSGSIPVTIGNLSKLKILILSANHLTGKIPPTISNITTLIRFAANQNKFSGVLPSGITRNLRILDLSYNKLEGPLPEDFLSPSELQSVDLSYNMLNGSIPTKLSPNLLRLRLGSNSFGSTIPVSFSALENLTYLELDNNSLINEVPAELGSCRSLALLNLAQNKLVGSLPASLGNLTNLEVLELQLNKLGGEIPIEITLLQKLLILNISWNSLTGSIPSSISKLQALSRLNLQGNNLSGSIPDSINRLNYLLELQLGQNQLSGIIPMMPIRLQIALNLSSNLFQGHIPHTLAQLKALEILDLSSNNFSGEIPDFLTQMESLTQLILSNNQLSGIVPDFKTYVSLNFCGNDGLIFTKSSTPANSTKTKKSSAVAIIFSVVAAVLAVGMVTIVALIFSRRFLKVNDQPLESEEVLTPPKVIQGTMLTENGIHKSKIDFTRAMEAVAKPWNIVLKTRFSTYYKATMPSGVSYFVKKLNWSDKIFQLGSHDKFGQELEVLGKLSNSNVMTPLAYVLTVNRAYLFYEYAQKSTLFDILHGKLGNALDWASRYSIAVGVAQGLAFLHGCNSGPILLLDLSSKNIMLKSLKEPLVGDIELCKLIDPSKSTGNLSTVAGSAGYIPPEYAYTMRVTMAGNVYSFGVVLLELLTGKPAVSEGTELAKWVLSNSSQQHRWDCILDFNIRNSISVRAQMLAVLKVALSCVSVSPETRPKMKSVLWMILNA